MERQSVKVTQDKGDIIPEEKNSLATPFWTSCTLEYSHLNGERKKKIKQSIAQVIKASIKISAEESVT